MDKILTLDTQQLQMETTGEKIIQEIQEWLLTRASSQEAAVLQDDKAQRLLVGVHTFPSFKRLFINRLIPIQFSVIMTDSLPGIQPARNHHSRRSCSLDVKT